MRLINADALDNMGYELHRTYREDANTMVYEVKKLGEIPTIEAEPICHGQWKQHPYEREYDVCTNCQTGVKRREYGWNDDGSEWVTEESYKFCPYCGAKMEDE